jgi:2-keto-4-pentenoate hydratase
MEAHFENIIENYLQVFKTKCYDLKSGISIEKLSLEESYQIQHQIIDARVKEGERIVGYKVGCTSKSIQKQFGLKYPIKGFITEPFIYDDKVKLDASNYENLSIEPEFVIKIGRDVTKEFLEHHEIDQAIESVAAGIELHNYKFCFEPTSQELIILNGIHAGLVIGEQRRFTKRSDLSLEGVGVFVNGELVASAIGAEIMMEGPLTSLRWLADELLQEGRFLKKGDIVIPGSPVQLIPLAPGDGVKVSITNWGMVEAFIS